MNEYKPKILFYGNCQLHVVAKWLNEFECIEALKPESYNIKIAHPWEKSIFYPNYVFSNINLFKKALTDADYYIFQDVVNFKFFKSKDLYNQCDGKKVCITNFFLQPPQELSERSITDLVDLDIKELNRRQSIIKSKYGDDNIDMSDWINDNWRHKFLWGDTALHPTMHYYHELFKQIKNKLFLDLNIDPLKHLPKLSHPLLSEDKRLQIQKIFPNIKM